MRVGTALRGRPSWDQFDDMTTHGRPGRGGVHVGAHRADPGRRRHGAALRRLLILAIMWIEALGFCGRGESGPFIEGGANIARDGLLPLNTAGGQLSGGRLHGFGLIHEASSSCAARAANARSCGPAVGPRRGGRRGERWRADRWVDVADARGALNPRTPRGPTGPRFSAPASLISSDCELTPSLWYVAER